MTGLREAAFRGDLNIVSLYKKDRKKVNEAGPDTQRTALHWAAWGGQNQVVACLMKAAKAKVDPLDFDRNTPLNLAILAPNVPISRKLLAIDLLLKNGADPTIPNRYGDTPLMNLMQLSRQIAPVLFHHREVMRNIMQRVDRNIRQKAEQLNRTFRISPDGVVSFDKIPIPFAAPTFSPMRMRT